MVKYSLQLKANLENVKDVVPQDKEEYRWHLKLKCANCREESDKWVYFTLADEAAISGSRGTAHLVTKCKMCSRENSVEALKDSLKSYNGDGAFQSILSLECRGTEPIAFDPRSGWCASGRESDTPFASIDLTEKEWADYDEKAGESVGIFEVESQFVRS